MLDAPVSGGVLAAEAGTLTFMVWFLQSQRILFNLCLLGNTQFMIIRAAMYMQVGGSEEAYLAAKPLLLAMGKSTVYCGGAGNGSVSFHTWKFNFF